MISGEETRRVARCPHHWRARQSKVSRFQNFLPEALYEGVINIKYSANNAFLVTHIESCALLCYTLNLILLTCVLKGTTLHLKSISTGRDITLKLSPWNKLRKGGKDRNILMCFPSIRHFSWQPISFHFFPWKIKQMRYLIHMFCVCTF